MGGILEAAGIGGFLDNRGDLLSDVNTEEQDWRALTEIWWEKYGSQPVRAMDVLNFCAENELLVY